MKIQGIILLLHNYNVTIVLGLQERHYTAGDTSCDHLFRSASALLWWWTSHREELAGSLTSR